MPPPPVPGSSSSSIQIYPPARGPELALEIEFEQLWEASEEEMRRALWTGEDGVELDEDPEWEEEPAPAFQPSPNPSQALKHAPPLPPPVEEDDEMEEGEEREEGEVLDDNPPPMGVEKGEDADGARASKRVKREKGKRNSRGGWALDESETAAMRRETERCFVGDR